MGHHRLLVLDVCVVVGVGFTAGKSLLSAILAQEALPLDALFLRTFLCRGWGSDPSATVTDVS